MRLLAYIGGLLVLVLTFVPCADNAVFFTALSEDSGIEQIASPDTADNDHYSLFCNGSCHAMASIIQEALVINIPFSYCTRMLPMHVSVAFKSIDLPFWQPPELFS
ncbi:hypothetical protein HDE68_005332 [Pedobacter cryoconitis]|uniref:Uncharacterized protein n=1 Tax=Pedobacter cryoconitis TaxID=188932 RepID=A0A7W8ZSI3_9SPHI|nr:hypothetical protein [Pedobacter cryoconitis]MBB5639387.1 hypothetical protein [Pedobacter cryoconitis]